LQGYCGSSIVFASKANYFRRLNLFFTLKTQKIMSPQRITAECQQQLEKAGKSDKITVLFRPKLKAIAEKEAKMAFEMLQGEQMAADKRAYLLGKLNGRYGKGKEFCQNYQDSRMKSQEKLIKLSPQATGLWLADVIAVTGTKAEIEDLAKQEDVESVEINPTFEVPEVLQTPLEDTTTVVDGSAWGLAKILAPEAWGGFGRGRGILVGHLDTGVDDTHPALRGKVAFFEEFDALGNPIGAGAPYDSGFHGTHTAGTIVGRTYRGVNIGVAPEARLASALVLGGGAPNTFSRLVGGMQWLLVTADVDVMNLSLGANGYFPVFNIPILISVLSGVNVVASIGNSGLGTSGGPGNDLFAIGVGATSEEDAAAGFSSGQTLSVVHTFLGPLRPYQKPDISAPGVAVLSSVPGPDLIALSGTSMAAPHVAGAIAILLSSEPTLRGDAFAVRNILLGAGTEDFGDLGKDQRFGFGRLDALSAAETTVSLVS
jgi:subtilisin family serine protease